MRGHVSEALKLVRIAYPKLLETNKELLFRLKCRQFVEMIGGCDKIHTEEMPCLSCHSELGSSGEGTPTSEQVIMLSSSPQHQNTTNSVHDNGEVSVEGGRGERGGGRTP